MKDDTAVLIRKAGTFMSSGDRILASKYCRRAIASNPTCIERWWELGNLSAQLECFPETERCCREVIARDPSISEARLYLGIALQRQSKLEEAQSTLKDALRHANGFADAHYYLGVVQQSMNKMEEALESYRSALSLGYEPASTQYNISLLLLNQGKSEEALEYGIAALKSSPDNLKYRQNFIRVLRVVCPRHASRDMLMEIVRSFEVMGIDASSLMKPGLVLLSEDRDVNHLLQLACSGRGDNLREGIVAGDFREVFRNRLLELLLIHTKIANEQFEILLGILRRTALDWLVNHPADLQTGLFDSSDRFPVALACQFFNTDYAAYTTPDEAQKAHKLALDMERQLRDKSADAASSLQIAVLCMYRPLYTRSWAGSFATTCRADSATGMMGVLLKAQLFDHVEECRIRDTIKSLTTVSDGVSISVRGQYEDSPYPRWNSVNIFTPVAFREDISSRFHCHIPPELGDSGPDILIAGCGTGRHAIMSATHYRDANVLAVDLSRTSLAYALRNTRELSVENIEYVQADILELGSLDKRFHVIESVGVLHHMQQPETGLRVLTGLLRDRGLLRIGLYSRHARRDVVAAREFIAGMGLTSSPDDIRQARQELTALEAGHPARRVLRFRDFYNLSECRDLLFHVHERQYELPGIAVLLKACGLGFIGFIFADPRIPALYREQFPDDPAMTNLQNWEEFEVRYPDAFAEMYDFMCQKS